MNKATMKIVGVVLGVIVLIVVVTGTTMAWFSWSSSANTTINAKTGCFTINYTKGSDVSGTLNPTTSYTAGVSTTVKLYRDSSCLDGTANIYLTTTAGSSLVTDKVLKYAVVQSGSSTPVATGTVDATSKDVLYTMSTIPTSTTNTYTVYIYLDATKAKLNHAGVSYAGYISADANQKK